MTPPTGPAPNQFSMTRAHSDSASTVRLDIHGYLDHSSVDDFLAATTSHLPAPDVRTLRLDCGGLTGLDSMGLSTLLMLRRRTDAAGVVLHVEHPSPALERLLEITGTLDYIVPGHEAEVDGASESQHVTYGHITEDAVPAGIPADRGGPGRRSAEDVSG
ncbi:STAS domain-containing protein [Streptomyces sp. NPDC060085]|uniref:STAS domain-containing protein n=1 Tax=Streptomyces sp. NPDC060085 TaxID=3347054 RepID=UPI0036532B52